MRSGIGVLVLVLAALSSSCGTDVLGPGIPGCGDDPELLTPETATLIQVQAVPSAVWGPCIDELQAGWEYVDQYSESGRSVFWLDSDRVGSRFLEVDLTESCDPIGATPMGSGVSGIDRLIRVDEEPGDIAIAVVPVADRHDGDARALVTRTIGKKLKGRSLTPYVDESVGSASERIQAALRDVGIVLVIDDVQATAGTVELHRSGHDPEVGISVEDALEEIEEDLGSPRYRAEWFHQFEGGCIVYRVDASGVGAESIAGKVREAIGFYPLAELRQAARDAGFDI